MWYMSSFLFFGLDSHLGPKMTSLIFSIFSSFFSLYAYVTFPPYIDEVYGYYNLCDYMFSIACGYFTYDFIICYKRQISVDLLFHAIASLTVNSIMLTNILPRHGVFLFTFEFSSIFLNLMHNERDAQFKKMYSILFGITFFIVRIVIGTYASIDTLTKLYLLSSDDLRALILFCIGSCSMILNYYWMYLITLKFNRKYAFLKK